MNPIPAYERRSDYGIAQRRRVQVDVVDPGCNRVLRVLRAELLRYGFDLADLENDGFTILEELARYLRRFCWERWLVRPAITEGMTLGEAAFKVAPYVSNGGERAG